MIMFFEFEELFRVVHRSVHQHRDLVVAGFVQGLDQFQVSDPDVADIQTTAGLLRTEDDKSPVAISRDLTLRVALRKISTKLVLYRVAITFTKLTCQRVATTG